MLWLCKRHTFSWEFERCILWFVVCSISKYSLYFYCQQKRISTEQNENAWKLLSIAVNNNENSCYWCLKEVVKNIKLYSCFEEIANTSKTTSPTKYASNNNKQWSSFLICLRFANECGGSESQALYTFDYLWERNKQNNTKKNVAAIEAVDEL